MAGENFFKEHSPTTLTSTGASMTNGSAASAGTIDLRSGGAANNAQDFQAIFDLLCQWATVTGIVANLVVAELYLVPAVNGTNYPDVDLSAGASVIPYQYRAGSFSAPKAPSAATNMRFASNVVDLAPLLYTVYVLNRSGQTISANWTLLVDSWRGQYT